MPAELSANARRLTLSRVVENRRKADALAERGIAIMDLGAGEPDFAAPPLVVEAAIRSLRAGQGGYVDPRGLPALRERIAAFETTRHGHAVSPEQVVVTSGSFCALSVAAHALLDPGDEVLIAEPFWGPYRNIVQIAGGVPVAVPGAAGPDGRFVFAAEALAERIGPRTKAMVLNSPTNPTGRVLTRREMEAVAGLAERHDLWVIADEVYSELLFGTAQHVSIAAIAPEAAARAVVVNSLSKTFAMTGWRLGYAVARPEAAEVMARINHYTTRCATSFVQHAAVTAFDDGLQAVEEMRQAYARRRDLVTARLNGMPGLSFVPPEGTFYAFPRLPDAWGGGDRFAARLLEEEGVVASAGSAYGPSAAQHIRFSFATSEAVLTEGFDRMERLVARILSEPSPHDRP